MNEVMLSAALQKSVELLTATERDRDRWKEAAEMRSKQLRLANSIIQDLRKREENILKRINAANQQISEAIETNLISTL